MTDELSIAQRAIRSICIENKHKIVAKFMYIQSVNEHHSLRHQYHSTPCDLCGHGIILSMLGFSYLDSRKSFYGYIKNTDFPQLGRIELSYHVTDPVKAIPTVNILSIGTLHMAILKKAADHSVVLNSDHVPLSILTAIGVSYMEISRLIEEGWGKDAT